VYMPPIQPYLRGYSPGGEPHGAHCAHYGPGMYTRWLTDVHF